MNGFEILDLCLYLLVVSKLIENVIFNCFYKKYLNDG